METTPAETLKSWYKKTKAKLEIVQELLNNLNLLNEILLRGRWQKPIIKKDHTTKSIEKIYTTKSIEKKNIKGVLSRENLIKIRFS